MDVTVVVPAFGERHIALAHERALPSTKALGVQVILASGEPPAGMTASAALAAARQRGLDDVTSEWIVYLDADDELTPGYLEAMATGTADVRAPAVEYHDHTGPVLRTAPPGLWRVRGHRHQCTGPCTLEGNWTPIGSMVRADLLRKVGGWHDHAWSEDYCVWLRCYLAGASMEAIPTAVYRAHTMPGGRNQATTEVRNAAHREIAAENGIPSAR